MIAHSHDEVRIYQRAGRLTCLVKKLRGALRHFTPPYLRSIKQPLLVSVRTSSGYYYKPIVVCTTNKQWYASPPLQARILPRLCAPSILPPKGLTLIANSPIIHPKEIAYSEDNDSLQRDCPNQECEGR